MLLCLVITSPAHDVLPIVCTDYTYDSEHGIAEGVPLAFDAAWVPIWDLHRSSTVYKQKQSKTALNKYVGVILTDGLEWCGLLWCFYQLFGLSFWWHPFTSNDEQVMQHYISPNLMKNKLIYTQDGPNFHFCVNYSCKHMPCFWMCMELHGFTENISSKLLTKHDFSVKQIPTHQLNDIASI